MNKIDNGINQELLHNLKKDINYIKKIPASFQTEEMAFLVIDKDITLFKYIELRTPQICSRAIEKDPNTIRYIEKPSKSLEKTAEIGRAHV